MVHPDIKGIALPVALEPITRNDGQNKNDCERVVAKRLLSDIASAYPRHQFIVIEDALASNAPIQLYSGNNQDALRKALFTSRGKATYRQNPKKIA